MLSTWEGILGFIVILMIAVVVGFLMQLHQRCRSDNGYNMGRNHMHDLGFSDDDINQGQDDEDAEFYVFRKKQNRNRKGNE